MIQDAETTTFLSTGDAWMDAMRRGDLAAAWRVSDQVLHERAGKPCWHWPRHQQYLWTGEPLAGRRVLVHCYHGLGDTIQFIRFAAPLRRIASHVSVWVQPALLPLVQTAAGVDEVLPLHDGDPGWPRDVDLELMEIPHALRCGWDGIRVSVPYLHPPPIRSELRRGERFRVAARRGELQVGVVWQSGDWDARRSIPFAYVRRWADLPGVRLHALQRGPALDEWSTPLGPISGSDDAVEAARAMQQLDLVISVDSMPAHLAGALGMPIWTLLHFDPDWRWMLHRADSPWYPTMRLFRQPQPGDWESVSNAVSRELVVRAAARGGPQ